MLYHHNSPGDHKVKVTDLEIVCESFSFKIFKSISPEYVDGLS